MKRFILSFILFISVYIAGAYPLLTPDAQISLLTYSKTNEVHAMYGHTALRLKDAGNDLDVIFNYGTFDFNSDDFVYRFVKGETDYILSISKYEHLAIECYIRNLSIREQILNLYPAEKQRLFDFLMKNAEAENRVYRYNFLFDNCASRPRLAIEKMVSGTVEYRDTTQTTTFRNLIRECTAPHPWLSFGIDLILGAPLDAKTTYKEQMFLPYYMEDAFNRAVIRDSTGAERRLVISDVEIIPAQSVAPLQSPFWKTPLFVALFVSILILITSFQGWKKGRFFVAIDFALFFVYGLAGVVIFFLSFLSTHPATNPNYTIFVMHPIHLIAAFLLLIPWFKEKMGWYFVTNSAVLSLFLILAWFLHQQFTWAFILLAVALLFRSGLRAHHFISNKNK